MIAKRLFHPTKRVPRLFHSPVDVSRCSTDGALVFSSQKSMELHAGHRIKSPTTISFFEFILIWIGVLH